MRARTRTILSTAGLVAVAMVAAGCGEAGQSGTDPVDPGTAGQGCAPIAGDTLVVLEDDRGLQTADNLIPAVNADVATPELVAALDTVSAALDTPKLIALNGAVDIDRQTPQQAAADFADAEGLTTGIAGGGSGEVVIGTAGFSESQILGALYDIVLTAAGFQASVTTVGNREVYEPELERGNLHVIPEYLGTLTEFLNAKVNGEDPEPLASSEVDQTLTALRGLGDQVGLVFGEPSTAANQNAFAVTEAFATEHGLRTLTDLAAQCSGVETLLGGPPECPQRPFCQPGLESTYGMSFGPFSSLDAGGPLTKQALRSGEISVGLVFSSDADLGGS